MPVLRALMELVTAVRLLPMLVSDTMTPSLWPVKALINVLRRSSIGLPTCRLYWTATAPGLLTLIPVEASLSLAKKSPTGLAVPSTGLSSGQSQKTDTTRVESEGTKLLMYMRWISPSSGMSNFQVCSLPGATCPVQSPTAFTSCCGPVITSLLPLTAWTRSNEMKAAKQTATMTTPADLRRFVVLALSTSPNVSMISSPSLSFG